MPEPHYILVAIGYYLTTTLLMDTQFQPNLFIFKIVSSEHFQAIRLILGLPYHYYSRGHHLCPKVSY